MSSQPIPAPPSDATATVRGLVSTGAQTFAGNKTFNGTVSTGNLSVSPSGGANYGVFLTGPNGNTISIETALGFGNGFLFNNNLKTQLAFISGAGSGSNGFSLTTAGARVKFSAGGTTDYLFSDGSGTITAAGNFNIGSGVAINGNTGAANFGGSITFANDTGPAWGTAGVYGDATGVYIRNGGSSVGSLRPASPGGGTLGTSASRWGNIFGVAGDFSGGVTIAGDASFGGVIASPNKAMFLYANGGSGVTETVRAASQRGDSGLKCVVVGTEQASPNAACVLFQVAKGITTAANDAGNGTSLFRVLGNGNAELPANLLLGNSINSAVIGGLGKLHLNDSAGATLQYSANTITIDSENVVASFAGKFSIQGDLTSPAKAAFRLVPQDAEPTGPNTVGDMYVTSAGVLKICTAAGSPGTWVSVGSQT